MLGDARSLIHLTGLSPGGECCALDVFRCFELQLQNICTVIRRCYFLPFSRPHFFLPRKLRRTGLFAVRTWPSMYLFVQGVHPRWWREEGFSGLYIGLFSQKYRRLYPARKILRELNFKFYLDFRLKKNRLHRSTGVTIRTKNRKDECLYKSVWKILDLNERQPLAS